MRYHGENEIPERLIEAIRAAPVVPEELVDRISRVTPVLRRRTDRRPGELTERELQILSCCSHGLTCRMVGDLLHISPQTVQSTLKRARFHLGAKSTTHAVALALRRGLIQ